MPPGDKAIRPSYRVDQLDRWLDSLRIRLRHAGQNAAQGAGDYWVIDDFSRVILFHTDGNRYEVDGHGIVARAGDMLLIPAHRRTRVQLPQGHRETFASFQLKLPPAGDLLTHVAWQHCLLPAASVTPELAAIPRLLVGAYQSRELSDRLQGQAWIIELARVWLVHLDRSEFDRQQKLMHRLAPAIRLIEDRFGDPLGLADLAASVGLSQGYFCSHFTEIMGTTPAAFLTRFRMQQAAAMLLTGQGSVGQIATAVGYADPYHFSRVFRRQFGHPPSRHRELAST